MSHTNNQTNFFRPVPDLQHIACAQDHDAMMDHDAFPRSGNSNSEKPATQDPVNSISPPVNSISLEAYALLAAAEAAAVRRADALDAGVMELDVNGSGWTLQSALDTSEHLPCMAPPKRFYRISWESISLRLLDRHQADRYLESDADTKAF